MRVGVPKELAAGENRAALDGSGVKRLVQAGFEVVVERGAGKRAGILDSNYESHGARIVDTAAEVWQSPLLLGVRAFGAALENGDEPVLYHCGQTLIAMVEPIYRPQPMRRAAELGLQTYALELIPRTTRAQSMDVLSSMSTIAGYRGVLLAAFELPKMFGLMMTAAGTLLPARVLVLGAGVAGLQAIASAKRLGGVVSAYDVRPAAREQIESVGGRFIDLKLDTKNAEDAGGYAVALGDEFYRRQTEALAEHVASADVVITTAAIPGARSPILVTTAAVERMRPGSVVVDLASDRGGNCELTRPDERVTHQGIVILGPTHVASQIPAHATQMFSSNLTNFVLSATQGGEFLPKADDDVIGETLVTKDGQVVHPLVRRALGMVGALLLGCCGFLASTHGAETEEANAARLLLPIPEQAAAPELTSSSPEQVRSDHTMALLASLTIFTLAVFVGFEVIAKVPPTLHTPLMSGSNAISGITVVGAILLAGGHGSHLVTGIGFLATILAMINVVGGFVVTDRMLAMFQRR